MKAKIATEKDKGKSIEVALIGGNPYFTYIWINDGLYTLSTKGRVFKLKRIK